ncbi:hypothetical protein Tco_1274110 [Tanacetum coccineum]
MKAVKEKEQLQKTVDSWKDSSKNLWKLVNSGMTSNSKVGLGYGIKSNNEVLSYEEEMNCTVFNCTEEDFVDKPLYNRFSKTDNFKGVPHPLTGDYTPKQQQEIDESLYVYGKKGPQKHKTSVSDDKFNEYSTCQSNDSAGSFGNTSEHSVEFESEIISVPKEVSESKQPIKDKETHKVNRKNWNDMMERELGEGYSFTKKKCFVYGSLSHLIKDCDYYEKKMARETEVKRVVNTGNWMAKPVWTKANRVNHSNKFVPRSVQLNAGRPNFNSVRPNINTGRTNINSVRPKVNALFNVNPETSLKILEDRGIFDSGCSGHMAPRVPRHHNMYSFDMKTPTPAKGFACLIAKATSDESKLWHRRGFRGAPRPLLPAMLLVATTNPNAGQEHHAVAQSQPSSSTLPVPSTSSPPVQSPPPIPASIPASTTTPTPIPASIPTPTPIPETEPEPFEHTFEEPSPVHQHFSPPQEQAQGQMTVDDLLQVVPQLISRIDSLETGSRGGGTRGPKGGRGERLDSEEEEPEAQGRKSQDDPLVSLVQGLVTPSMTNVNASGEEQVEDISPNTLEAAKTLSREEASLAKAIRLDTLQKEEVAKQVHLDSLLAQRIAEEEELNEQQKKRRAQVQFEAQHYTDEDWDLIRAKIN